MTVPPGPPGWPGWAWDVRIVDHWTPQLTAALRNLLQGAPAAARRIAARSHPTGRQQATGVAKAATGAMGATGATGVGSTLVAKAKVPKKPGPHDTTAARQAAETAARAELLTELVLDPAQLRETLRGLYADSWAAGARAGLEAQIAAGNSGAVLSAYLTEATSDTAWANWTPGWPQAAALLDPVRPGTGLAALLDADNVTIKGITGTTLDSLSRVIGDGVAAGDTIDDIAAKVTAFVNNPVRAEMIAWTETARAMTKASIESYRANLIQAFDWLVSPDACPICEAMAESNPHDINDDAPPAHPSCRCAASPVVTVTEAAFDSGNAEQDIADDGGDSADV